MPETIWEAEPHTLAKHKILKTYLQAWIAILSRQSAKVIRYIDGFAGPGIYKDGEPGSPVLALRITLDHSQALPTPVEFTFVEQDEPRFDSLKAKIDELRAETEASDTIAGVHLHNGDCVPFIKTMLSQHPGQSFGPALFFLDQFGYKGVPIDLVRAIFKIEKCEIFFYLNWNQLNRFITDETKHSGISSAFGSDEWKACIDLSADDRPHEFLRLYKNALRDHGRAKYVLSFAMYSQDDRLLNWLFFCTNSLSGLKEMKKAMWKVAGDGAFRFSDKDDPSQIMLLSGYTQEWLSEELVKRLDGQILTVAEIEKYVLVETPNYKFRGSLKILEDENLLQVPHPPEKRRRGTFPDKGMKIVFAPDPTMPKNKTRQGRKENDQMELFE